MRSKSYLLLISNGVYSDWRRSTKHELYELDAIFDFKRNGDVKIQFEGAYWLAGKMVISGGPECTLYVGKKGYVRAVRPKFQY